MSIPLLLADITAAAFDCDINFLCYWPALAVFFKPGPAEFLLPLLFLWPWGLVELVPFFWCNKWAWGDKSVGERSSSACTINSFVSSAFYWVKFEVTERKSEAESLLVIARFYFYLLFPPDRVWSLLVPLLWLSADDCAKEILLLFYWFDCDLPWIFSCFLCKTYSWLPLSISSTVRVNIDRVCRGMLILS